MVNDMKLIFEDKEINLTECKSFYSRLKGFMLFHMLQIVIERVKKLFYLIDVIVFILSL